MNNFIKGSSSNSEEYHDLVYGLKADAMLFANCFQLFIPYDGHFCDASCHIQMSQN